MKVKRLELQGFKSFKDKTVIHFDDGVTGIVGPNGCGKSNIVDSFFWVMGEQSAKHLRGTQSSDLIFSGSEKFSPASLAEVTMVLSTGAPKDVTTDPEVSVRDLPTHMRYQEISVTRRLYRSGDSEYLINGQTCRLRDVHELFMDTGAGPKAYSIIEQGQISRIVASKAEDRRVLIEEAAGITKFKARKKESQRKIEATQQNLERISDVIMEIDRQLSSLERQAAKARQYKKLKEELKDKELLLGRKRLYDLKNSLESLNSEISLLSGQETEKRAQLNQIEVDSEGLKLRTVQLQQEADDLLLSVQTTQKEVSSRQTKIELHKRSVQELHDHSQNLEQEIQGLNAHVLEVQTELSQVEADSTDSRTFYETAEHQLKEKQADLDVFRKQVDEASLQIDQRKRELMGRLSKQTELSNQVHGYEARVDALSVQINQIGSRYSDKSTDLELCEERTVSGEAAYLETSEHLTEVKNNVDLLRSTVGELSEKSKTLHHQEQDTRQKLVRVESQHATLTKLLENHEGVQTGVRDLLKDDQFREILGGVVADVLEAHPGYEFALEAALKDLLDTLFVRDLQGAQTILHFLKEKNLGRVSLWCRDLLAQGFYQGKVQDLKTLLGSSELSAQMAENGLKRLSDVVRVNHTDSESILALLNRFLVVDTTAPLLETLSTVKSDALAGYIIVSREGDLIDAFGRIQGGGAKALESGLFARKSEHAKLTQELEVLTQQLDRIVIEMQQVDEELELKRSDLEIQSEDLRETQLRERTQERDLASLKSQLQSLRLEVDRLEQEKVALESDRTSLWEKLDSIREELIGLEGAARSEQDAIDQQVQVHRTQVEDLAHRQTSLVQLRVDFAAAQEKYRYAKERTSQLERDLRTSKQKHEDAQRSMNRKLDEKDTLQQELLVLEESMEDFVQKAQEQEDEFRERREVLEQARHQLSGFLDAQRVLLRSVEEVSSKLSASKLKSEKFSLEFQSLLQTLFERYGFEESHIAFDEVFEDLNDKIVSQWTSDLDQLREKLRKIGEVNITAVEEYDEQKKRHEFLISQRDDLLRSIQDLEKAIERINKTSEDRFFRAFEEINKRFEQIFPLVFGGGMAKLSMTNPEDLAETGIDIVAQPPGKKMGSIQLMSGGEKALTAVALIFSIFLIKPSPFCVLDEVDAPLDDHNVGKFNMLLKEMSERSQFIIITHNKRTMELNDKLYGVTMEDAGVSKMVGIQLQA